jgi:hypothetical protein
MQRRYYTPALAQAKRLGIARPLDVAIVYDSLIQHGVGDDPDGFDAIVARVDKQVGRLASADRRTWLSTFLDVRASVLAHPSDAQHVVAWPPAVERPKVLAGMLSAGADDLNPPLTVTAYGSTHVLGATTPDDDTDAKLLAGVPNAMASSTQPSALSPPSESTGPTDAAGPSPSATNRTSPPPATNPPQPEPTTPSAAPPPIRLQFPGFANSAGLRLNGSATVSGQQLSLTRSPHQAASAGATTLVDSNTSFSSSFTVLISAQTDGVAFVIQTEGQRRWGAWAVVWGTAPDLLTPQRSARASMWSWTPGTTASTASPRPDLSTSR